MPCVQCVCCHKNFDKSQREFNKSEKLNRSHYCSRDCFWKFNSRQKEIPCGNCGKLIIKKQSDFAKSKSGQVYCSSSCSVATSNKLRIGEKHPLFDDYGKDYRKKAFANLKPCCDICGYSTLEVLHVHHKDENRLNNDLSNLIILCPTHHVEVHKGLLTI